MRYGSNKALVNVTVHICIRLKFSHFTITEIHNLHNICMLTNLFFGLKNLKIHTLENFANPFSQSKNKLNTLANGTVQNSTTCAFLLEKFKYKLLLS